MKRTARIEDILRPLGREETQAYLSNALQVADVLEWILVSLAPMRRGLGLPPVRVMQSTFSISEEFLRRMWNVRKAHGCELEVIIDRKALMKTVSLWGFVSRVYDKVWVSDNHSKLLLVDGGADGLRVAMATSQNLTRGNRAESAVVTTSPGVYHRLVRDYGDLRDNHSCPMHDIMPAPSGRDTALTAQPRGVPSYQYTEEIERLASCFVPISDIAIILNTDAQQLREAIADAGTPESAAYRRGKARSRIALKEQEMELAKIGSPLGMQSVRENLLQMEQDED